MNVTQRRRIDYASLALAVVGVISGMLSLVLIVDGKTPLIILPSLVAIATGVRHLTKLEAVIGSEERS